MKRNPQNSKDRPLIPQKDEFLQGIRAFEKHEKRDAMYKISMRIVNAWWQRKQENLVSELAEGLGVLLLTWNNAFYRYGIFDFDELELCIQNNIKELESFRDRNISDLNESDASAIMNLFNSFLRALQIAERKNEGRRSPVAVAKAIHLLAPDFFPIWDDKIARNYAEYYSADPARHYFQFCSKMKTFAEAISPFIENIDRSVLKYIDEYNYAKFTKKWI